MVVMLCVAVVCSGPGSDTGIWSKLYFKIQNTLLSLSRNCFFGAIIHDNNTTHKTK